MVDGSLNKKFGWTWLLFTGFVLGLYVIYNIRAWAEMGEPARAIRTMFRHAHTMGSMAAFINILIGMNLGEVKLGESAGKAASYLAVAGAVLFTLGWLVIPYAGTSAVMFAGVALLGSSVGIMAYGYLKL